MLCLKAQSAFILIFEPELLRNCIYDVNIFVQLHHDLECSSLLFFYDIRLRGTDEIFQQLEDHQVTLSTMKASRFVKAFEKTVDTWERALSTIMECIEMTLTVQRQWMYLEVSAV